MHNRTLLQFKRLSVNAGFDTDHQFGPPILNFSTRQCPIYANE